METKKKIFSCWILFLVVALRLFCRTYFRQVNSFQHIGIKKKKMEWSPFTITVQHVSVCWLVGRTMNSPGKHCTLTETPASLSFTECCLSILFTERKTFLLCCFGQACLSGTVHIFAKMQNEGRSSKWRAYIWRCVRRVSFASWVKTLSNSQSHRSQNHNISICTVADRNRRYTCFSTSFRCFLPPSLPHSFLLLFSSLLNLHWR